MTNSAVRIDSESKTNEQLLRDLRQRLDGEKARGVTLWCRESRFVSAHQTISASVHKNDCIGPERASQPFVSRAHWTRPGRRDCENRRLAIAVCQPSRQMHFREI